MSPLAGQLAGNDEGRNQHPALGRRVLQIAESILTCGCLRKKEKHIQGILGAAWEQAQAASAPEQVQAASASEHAADNAGDWPVFSARMIQEWVLDRLIEINHDLEISYNNDLIKMPDGDQRNLEITGKVKKLGFDRPDNGQNDSYIYTGNDDDYARKLCEFSEVRPLVYDCASAINWLTKRAWLEFLGKEHFNTLFIERVCEGRLAIEPVFMPAPENVMIFHHPCYGKGENPLPPGFPLQRGDHLWIQGPPDAYAWRPTGQWNGHNVLVDKSDTCEISLWGFASTSIHGHWSSYDDLRDHLLKSYNSPLTLRDFRFLREMSENDPERIAPHSSLRYSSVYKWLQENRSDAFNRALELLEDPDADLNQVITGLLPPESQSIRGVRTYSSMRDDPVTQEQMLSLFEFDSMHSHATFEPEIPPEREFSDLIPGFETQLPHQRQLYAVMEEFYEACAGRIFPGLILHGDAGVGKTMACRALVNRLKEEGCRIWQADAQTSDSLLSPEDKEAFEALASGEIPDGITDDALDKALAENETRIGWMMEKFRQEWEQADLIFIDDADSDEVLSAASRAIVRYAQREEGKIFLLVNKTDTPPNPEAFLSERNAICKIEVADH